MGKGNNTHRHAHLEHLPHVDDNHELLEPKAALAAFFVLRRLNPHMHEGTQGQITQTQNDLMGALRSLQDSEGYFRLSEPVLHGIIAQSIIAGSAHTATTLGRALTEISLLNNEIEQGESEHPLETDASDD